MKTRLVDTLIVGAGASGLSLASRLGDQPSVLTNQVGGLISSNISHGYTFDFGGHVYTTNDPRTDVLMRKAGAKLHSNRVAIFGPGRVPYPVQDYADRLGMVAKAEPTFHEPRNFVEYCINHLGQEFTEKFMIPFNERVWSTDPHQMDFDWVRGRVKLREEGDPTKWGMNSSFLYAPGQQIVDVLAYEAKSNGASIGNGYLISLDEDKHLAAFTNGSDAFMVKYKRLFLTTRYFTSHFRANYVASIGIGFNGYLPLEPFHWMYCGFGSYVHRITYLSRYYEGLAPIGHQSLLLEIPTIGGNVPDPVYSILYGRGKDRATEAVEILKNAGVYVDKRMIDVVWGSLSLGYPVPTIGVRKQVAELKQELAKKDVYLAGRWGSHGYFNLQHIFDDADAAVDFADHGTSKDEYLNSSFYYKTEAKA